MISPAADPRTTLIDLRRQFAQGDISRETFWQHMREHHRALEAYAGALGEGEVDGITIEAGGFTIRLRNGLAFHWDADDLRSAPNMVLNHGEYEAKDMRLLLALARDSRVIFDIGANVGWHALHLLTAAPADARLYAFEPVPTTFERLKRNLAANDGVYTFRICATNIAFAAETGTATFFIPRVSGSSAASQRPLFSGDENKTVTCALHRLDDFVVEQGISTIDLIKCDVEGAELFVFKGGYETISRSTPMIFVEMLRKWARAFGYHPNDTISLLAQCGYQCWYFEDGRLNLLPVMTDDTRETNFLFLHRERHVDMPARISSMDVA